MAHLRVRRNHRYQQGMADKVSVRPASPDDTNALEQLAQLDGGHVPNGPLLLAEVGGEPRAALSLSDGRVFADPFHPTTRLVELLNERAVELSA